MDPNELVRLGRTSVQVSRLGVGLAPMIGATRAVDDHAVDAILRQAHLSGLRYVDVSPLYGLGRSEAALRRAANMVGADGLAVSTKAGRLLRPRTRQNRLLVRARELRYAEDPAAKLREYGRFATDRLGRRVRSAPAPTSVPVAAPVSVSSDVVAIHDFTPAGLRRSAAESLDRLGRDRVEILLLHDPDGLSERQLRAAWQPFTELRDRGRAAAIGISSNSSASMTRMLGIVDPDVVLVAGRYTIVDQAAMDDLLPTASERGIGVILGGVFHGGILADPQATNQFDYRPARELERRRAARLTEIARTFGVPTAAAAIQFAAAHPAVASVLVGAASAEELAEDVRLAQLPIPPGFWDALVRADLVRPDAPRPNAEQGSVEAAAS